MLPMLMNIKNIQNTDKLVRNLFIKKYHSNQNLNLNFSAFSDYQFTNMLIFFMINNTKKNIIFSVDIK